MDNVTHTLFALTLANVGLRRSGRGVAATLVLASSAPDVEFVTGLLGDRLAYLSVHRGPTHGPMALGLGALAAAAVYAARRWRRPAVAGGPTTGDASFRAMLAAGIFAAVCHVAMDFPTSYGTRLLSPFSDVWYGADWMPIMDPFLWAILGACLLAGRLRPERRARIAAVGLVLIGGYYAVRASAHEMALNLAIEREAELGIDSGRPPWMFAFQNARRPAALPAALPRPASPFRWRLIVRTPDGYELSEVDLLQPRRKREPGQEAVRFPIERAELVREAATAPTAKAFLDFSRFPSVEVRRHRGGGATVHWYDVRFGRRAGPGDWRSATSPFGAWVQVSAAGEIVRHGLGPG